METDTVLAFPYYGIKTCWSSCYINVGSANSMLLGRKGSCLWSDFSGCRSRNLIVVAQIVCFWEETTRRSTCMWSDSSGSGSRDLIMVAQAVCFWEETARLRQHISPSLSPSFLDQVSAYVERICDGAIWRGKGQLRGLIHARVSESIKILMDLIPLGMGPGLFSCTDRSFRP